MPDKTLLLMLDEVRGTTLSHLARVDERTARWRPQGMANSILWHAGHCYTVVEWLTMEALAKTPQAPPGWFEMFSWDSRPAEIADERWPPLSTVVQMLKDQHVRMRDSLAGLTERQLDSEDATQSDSTVRKTILHALQDEASHKGEIWLLHKLHRRKQAQLQ